MWIQYFYQPSINTRQQNSKNSYFLLLSISQQHKKIMSRYPSDPLQKMRILYKQAQQQVNNNQLNRITQQRMKKRYSYAAKQVQRKQANNDKQNIQELIFYRNKFHSLMVLVVESMRESYNKIKFQTEVKNILKDNWKQQQKPKSNQNQSPLVEKQNQKNSNSPFKFTTSQIKNSKQITKNQDNKPSQQEQNYSKSHARRSVSPLQQFFTDKQKQIKQSKKVLSFQSVVPQSQLTNSKLLSEMRSMNKRSNNGTSTYRERTQQKVNHEDSRLRDLRRQNEQLQKILRKRQKTEVVYYDNNGVQNLQKQVLRQQKINKDLRQKIGYTENKRDRSPYQISLRNNNVYKIEEKNLIKGPSKKAMELVEKQRSVNKSQTKSRSNSFINDQKSIQSNASSIVQKEKQVYINSTPQILFENELIKILVVRFPLRIQQKHISSTEKLNPQDLNPNQERLQLIVINNASKIVNNNELNVKLDYDYDKHCHKLQSFKKPNTGYSKIADTAKDIVFREIVRIKLLDTAGYNEQIKVMVKAQFSYDSEAKKKRIFNQMGKNRIDDNFYIEVKLPVTFIEFSSKPFSHRHFDSKKTKLTIKPNPFYDTLEHTYMNTNLPFLKSTNPRVLKQHAVLFGRSFVHDKNGKGTYLQSEISLAWFEKKETKYITIETIQQWVYLLAYIFLDVEQEEQEFQRQFRKPSMHVYFNLQNKQYF